MSESKTLPQCDCINDCGDDDRVAGGQARPCSQYHKLQAASMDYRAVQYFSSAMSSKLAVTRDKGRSGWHDKSQCSAEHLSQLLRDHVDKGDPVDVANFCMFLYCRGERIAPAALISARYEICAHDRACMRMSLTDLHAIASCKYPMATTVEELKALEAAAAPVAVEAPAADVLDAVRKAVRDYHHALDTRKHGGIADHNAIDAIQAAPGMEWPQAARQANTQEWPQPGDLVRYGDGVTALALHGEPHASGWHGVQCMGGYTFYTKVYKPSDTDRQQWMECAVRHRRKSVDEARREAGLEVQP